MVGQCDKRVSAIVAWDNLAAVKDCTGVQIPAAYRSTSLLHAPALGTSNDYAFNVQPATSAPNARAKDAGYRQLVAAGIDSASIVLRGATHLEYTYIPLVLPASERGERIASYFTLAWFDRYLRGDASAVARLTATAFDGSVDRSAIGTGGFDPALAAADPTNRAAGNVPFRIAGIPVANAVSFYYLSQYAVHEPGVGGALRACGDVRKGCPTG